MSDQGAIARATMTELRAEMKRMIQTELRAKTGVVPGGPYGSFSVDSQGRVTSAGAGGGIPTNNTARFSRTGTQSIVDDGNYYTIVLNQDNFTGADIYSYDDTTGIITFDASGVYLVIARAVFASNATGNRWLAGLSNVSDIRAAVNGDVTTLECNGLFEQAASDTMSISVKQNSGGALNLVNNLCSVYIARVGL